MALVEQEPMWTCACHTELRVTGRRDVSWSAGGCLLHAEPQLRAVQGCGECGLCQSQLALSFPFVQSVFGILLFMIRIVPAAAVCSCLFPLKQEVQRGSVFLEVQLKSPVIPLVSFYKYVDSVCLSVTLIPCFSSFSLKLSLWWLCSRER